MNNKIENQYTPDYVSPPGETLLEVIEDRGMTQAELADRTGRPRKTISEIINGKAIITPETALQLERVLGIPARFWLDREQHYRESLARQEEVKRLEAHFDWLDQFPIREMVKRGWIETSEDKVKQIQSLLGFFGVASPQQWQSVWNAKTIAFRKSDAFECDVGAIAAWLRQGELVAQNISCSTYDEKKFREALLQIRSLTVKPPDIFQPAIEDLCAGVGVAVVFMPELPRIRVSGATQWLTSTKAVIQLSLRYKSDDHLWFAFFHEAGHILLHNKRDVFLEGVSKSGTTKGQQELEADTFAANYLIPPSQLSAFLKKSKFSKVAIQQFAAEIGVASGIVVGRLQHDEVLHPSHCNELKQRFEWI
jgi:HTH-type transcriptional regulator/antitoxin HigA